MSIHFSSNKESQSRKSPTSLDVILVNAKSETAPVKPNAVAQKTYEGGGELDKGRSKSFLPPTTIHVEGDEIYNATASRIEAMRQEQQGLMTQLKKTPLVSKTGNSSLPSMPELKTDINTNMTEEARALLRREAEIFRRIADQDARPKRFSVGPSTQEVEYALYYRQWVERVEKVGNANYPISARGRNYSLVMTVSIFANGTVERIIIERSSGNTSVDEAAKYIVKMGVPFSRFTQTMKARYGVLDITMGWNFSNSNEFTIENGE